jgi:hypothetical protein
MRSIYPVALSRVNVLLTSLLCPVSNLCSATADFSDWSTHEVHTPRPVREVLVNIGTWPNNRITWIVSEGSAYFVLQIIISRL